MAEFEPKAVWPGWETVKILGRGSFGAVYEIRRDVLGDTEKAALKLITIPQSSSEIDELYGEGYDDESITNTFKLYLKSIVAEYSLMRKLNGSANVVNCDDVRYVQHEDGFGWDIYIKMELLTPLNKALPKEIPDETVIRVGTDLCKALVLCKKHNIIHRDIKPANIFVSDNGDYKLGDFGIAKTVEKTSGGTKTGTYEYMAPEVYLARPYGSAVDIYSLGMVLYWLLNERRTPFLALPPALPTGMDKEQARSRRFNGEAIPAPAHGSPALQRIVLKAVAFDPKDRYRSAEEMLRDLEALAYNSEFGIRNEANSEFGVRNSELDKDAAEARANAPAGATFGRPSVPTAEPRINKPVGAIHESPAPGAKAKNDVDATVSAARPNVPAAVDGEATVSAVHVTAPAAIDGEATVSAVHTASAPAKTQPAAPAKAAPSGDKPAKTDPPKPAEKPKPAEEKPAAPAKPGKKKLLPVLIAAAALVLVLIFVLLPKGGKAEPETPTGAIAQETPEPMPVLTPEPVYVTGDYWDLKNGVLTIRGNGKMPDFRRSSEQPWADGREKIDCVVIEKGITSIGNYAFSGCNSLTTIEIPSSVTSIGDWAFYYCSSLTAVEIPSSVTSIGDWAFSYCSSLTTIEIPSSVTSIGNYAFFGCNSLTAIEIPDSVTRLGESAFSYCNSLSTVEIPGNVAEISNAAFYKCASLTAVEIPSSVTSIGNSAFSCCSSLRVIEIPSSVTSIGNSAFYYCSSLTAVEIPSSVTSIGDYAFSECNSLTTIEIPSSVTSIGNNAFYSCNSLTAIEIPSSVTSIGDWAFSGCNSLTDLYYGGTEVQWNALVGGADLRLPDDVTIHFAK